MTKLYSSSVLPGERFVPGPTGDVGYIAKRPGHGAALEKMLEERAQERVLKVKTKEKIEDAKKVAYMNKYYKKFDELTVRASIQRMVELGMEEADNYFKVKQNKLRQLLLEDNSALVEEYTAKAQTSLERMLEKEKLKAEMIANSKSDADKEKAEQIYADMVMKDSEEFKKKLRLLNTRNISEANKEQIRVKENQKLLEQEEQKFWEEERRKVFDRERAVAPGESEEERRILYESLEKQIEDREIRRRQQNCLDEVEEERNQKIRKVWEDRLTRREEEARRSRDLHEKALGQQIESNRVMAERNLRDDLLMESIMVEDKRKKAEREAAAYESNKLKSWNELVVFKESMVQYRKALVEAEEECERGIAENRRAMDRKQWEIKKAAETARRHLRTDCTRSLKRMMAEKAKKAEELKSLDLERLELVKRALNVNDELDVTLARRTAVDRIAYNKAQTKYMEALVQRQKQEDEEMLRKMRQVSLENSQRVRESLERPIAEIASKMTHPFYKVLRNQQDS